MSSGCQRSGGSIPGQLWDRSSAGQLSALRSSGGLSVMSSGGAVSRSGRRSGCGISNQSAALDSPGRLPGCGVPVRSISQRYFKVSGQAVYRLLDIVYKAQYRPLQGGKYCILKAK